MEAKPTTAEMVARIKCLDDLYLAADRELTAAQQATDPSQQRIHYRRWRYYRTRYDRVVAEGGRFFRTTETES